MANPACASGDGNAASFIGTFLETGDTVALCDECLVAWTAAMLQTMTGVDPTPFLQAISEGDAEPPEGPDAIASPAASVAGEGSGHNPDNGKPAKRAGKAAQAAEEPGHPDDAAGPDKVEPTPAA